MTMQCSLGHWLGSTRDRPWERAILLLNFPSVTLLPAVVDNHWMAIIELWYSETFSCHTTTEHDSQILRNQLAHILGNQLATLGFYKVDDFVSSLSSPTPSSIIIISSVAVCWKLIQDMQHMADRVPHGDKLIWQPTVGKWHSVVWCGVG